MNALQIISAAMRNTNALASGETPTSAEAQDSLSLLNQMMSAWSAERYMVFTIVMQQFTLVPNQGSYTLGTGGDFNYPRPSNLYRAGIVWLANPQQPLEIPLTMLTDDEWATVPIKNITSTIPQYLYNDGAFPFMNLNFWCIPTIADDVRLYMWQRLQTFADLTTDYSFPDGYDEAIQYNLAIRLAANNIGTILNPMTLELARLGIARVKSLNMPLLDLEMPSALSGGLHYNWISDLYQK